MEQEEPTQPKETSGVDELVALTEIVGRLEPLSEGARSRIIRWINDRFYKSPVTVGFSPVMTYAGGGGASASVPKPSSIMYDTLAELMAAANPSTDADRVLVAAYWAQVREQREELDGLRINRDLKNLGYPIGNITNAFTSLMTRRPAFIVQLKKAGSSKQARKTYKLTTAGAQAVEVMIGTSNATE